MDDGPEVTAKAKRVVFDLGQILPPDDPLTVPLLRLMMAVDDVRHLQKLLIVARERADVADEIERSILNGELGHLFRLLCGHLREAQTAFRNLEEKCPRRFERALAGDDRAKAALETVRQAFRPRGPQGVHDPFLHEVRNQVAFHYSDEKLREAFKRHLKAGHIKGIVTLTPFSGLGRYTVTDHLANLVLVDVLGGDITELPQKFLIKVGEVIALAGALAYAVDYLLIYLFGERPKAILEERDGVISVDPLLQRAREKVERERKAQGS
jgi:hypothetical protein